MTKEEFIRKWLYTEEKRDEMRNDLDNVIKPKTLTKKTIEERKEKFIKWLHPFEPEYGATMLNEFFAYWTEHGINDRKMRFEKEKSFGLSRRLATWKKNKERYEKNRTINRNGFKSDTTRKTIESFEERVNQKG